MEILYVILIDLLFMALYLLCHKLINKPEDKNEKGLE